MSSHLDDIARVVPDYEVFGEIGRGEFGVVWRARHRRLGREVAIKELVGWTRFTDQERFRREARLLAGLDHPHVVTVFDYRELGAARLLIMEHLGGGTFADARDAGIDLAGVLKCGVEAALGLQHAHDHGVLHRDVKPENLMFDDRRTLKVTDFGVAGVVADVSSVHMTTVGTFLGTPAYISPELASFALGEGDAPITPASDQYALAAALYETLSGRLTHDSSGGAFALCRRRMAEPARALSERVDGLPRSVEQAIMRALERDPRDRFASMLDFAAALSGDEPRAIRSRGLTTILGSAFAESAVETTLSLRSRLLPRNNLPPLDAALIAREPEVVELSGLLSEHRLVTLTAMGGVGKTRLALRVAHEFADRVADGVWFVDLTNLSDLEAVGTAVARALGLRDVPADSATDELADRLSDRAALLVLDNCEHLLEATAELANVVLDRCPTVTILATSRTPLRVRNERVMRLAPLTIPAAGATPREVAASGAAHLFTDRARRQQPSFEINDTNVDAVGAIVRRLDGIPLALELAAARMRSMSVSEIAARLDRRFRLLTTGDHADDARRQTLRGTIDWSYDLLDPAEQRVLCRASVFAGGFDLDAAQALLGDDTNGDAFDVLDLVDQLIGKSLILRDEDGAGRSRYRLLESIREYGAERLAGSATATPSPADELTGAHLDHYASVAEAIGPSLYGLDQVEENVRLKSDHENFIAALHSATRLPEGAAAGLRLASALWYYWTRNGIATTVIAPLAVLCSFPGDDESRAAGCAVLTRSYCAAGRSRDALDAANLAVELSAHYARGTPRLRALQSRAIARSYRGDYAAALSDADACIAGAGQDEDLVVLAEARSIRSMTLRALGEPGAARDECRRVVDIYRMIGDLFGLATELMNLTDQALEANDLGEASRCLTEAGPLVEQHQSAELASCYYGNVGLVALRTGDELTAREHFARAVSICERINDRQCMLNNLVAFAYALARTDSRAGARLHFAARALASRFELAPDPNEQRLLDDTAQIVASSLSQDELTVIRRDADKLTPREMAKVVAALQTGCPPAAATLGSSAP